MNTVKMPRASWESVLIGLETLIDQGYLLKSEYQDIDNQIAEQEY
jgi:hypothetical protein